MIQIYKTLSENMVLLLHHIFLHWGKTIHKRQVATQEYLKKY